jgi:hypothetical protein
MSSVMDRQVAEGDAHVEISFSPNVSLVSTVRRFVTDFYARVLADDEATSRVAMATHELLENAVRYSADGLSTVRVSVHRASGGAIVTIDTRNRAAAENVGVVVKAIEKLHAAGDPVAYYQLLIRETAQRKEGSGLGLGRVCAEADMTLSVEIEEGNVIHLRATAKIDPVMQSVEMAP